MQMAQEIERKFLLHGFPHDRLADGTIRIVARKAIDQTYLALTETEEIRVRRLDQDGDISYTHTYKRGHGLSREEVEVEISAGIYEQLLCHSGRKPLKKTRTTVTQDGREFDIDEYEQFNLISVEVEFESEEEAKSFQPPDWFGPELGSEFEYRNKQLWAQVQSQ